MREMVPRRPRPPANDNADKAGRGHAPEAAAPHNSAPLGYEWVDTEIADDATVIEADGGDPAVIAVPWS
ncbi:hypothetical protein [Lichenibacterium dinghuense]|uniref:hypothetical protein n=1 Tax=Lichenibacterium dinghuense TaxID=2895977 RepID=UPI001F2E3ED8|nr:hypothetical protein [Lichenibacterium sp. 6Y81]